MYLQPRRRTVSHRNFYLTWTACDRPCLLRNNNANISTITCYIELPISLPVNSAIGTLLPQLSRSLNKLPAGKRYYLSLQLTATRIRVCIFPLIPVRNRWMSENYSWSGLNALCIVCHLYCQLDCDLLREKYEFQPIYANWKLYE